jgi:hypothetical protein
VRLSKPAKILIGVLSFIAPALLVLFIVLVGWEMTATSSQSPIGANPVGWFVLFLVIFILLDVLLLGLSAFYLAYIVRTRRLRTREKWFWGVLVVGVGPIAMPVFFHRYVWPTREEFLKRLSRKSRSHE